MKKLKFYKANIDTNNKFDPDNGNWDLLGETTPNIINEKAESIPFDNSNTTINANNVQKAIEVIENKNRFVYHANQEVKTNMFWYNNKPIFRRRFTFTPPLKSMQMYSLEFPEGHTFQTVMEFFCNMGTALDQNAFWTGAFTNLYAGSGTGDCSGICFDGMLRLWAWESRNKIMMIVGYTRKEDSRLLDNCNLTDFEYALIDPKQNIIVELFNTKNKDKILKESEYKNGFEIIEKEHYMYCGLELSRVVKNTKERGGGVKILSYSEAVEKGLLTIPKDKKIYKYKNYEGDILLDKDNDELLNEGIITQEEYNRREYPRLLSEYKEKQNQLIWNYLLENSSNPEVIELKNKLINLQKFL